MIGDPRNGLPRTRILSVILITENINGKLYILMGARQASTGHWRTVIEN